MKNLIITYLIALSHVAFSQTEEMEKASMKKRFERGLITNSEYMEMGKKWQELRKEFNGIPEFPYNEEKDIVEYSFIKEYPNLDKEKIFNRVKEWAAISFGNINSALHYENISTGKLILKGYFDVKYIKEYKNIWGSEKETIGTNTCFQTFVFTVKDNKVKLQILSIEYEFEILAWEGTNYYTYKEKIALNNLFPITSIDPLHWKGRVNLLKETEYKIEKAVTQLNFYILDYQNDYSF